MNEPLGPKEKLTVLLQEYSSLRQEIVNRTNNGFQLVAVGAALFTWAIKDSFDLKLIIGLSFALLCLLAATLTTFGNVYGLSKRVRQIESEVNECAGEPLLRWETEFGGAMRWGKLIPRCKKSALAIHQLLYPEKYSDQSK